MAAQKVFGFFLLLTLGVSLSPGSVIGAEAGDLILGHFDASKKSERIEVARSVLERVERLSQFVPAPKPSEEAWVQGERLEVQKITNPEAHNSRTHMLYESPEFQNSKLFFTLADLRAFLRCAADRVPIKTEMKCWSSASLILTDSSTLNDGIMILRRAGRLPKDIEQQAGLGPEGGSGYNVFLAWYGRGILEHLIIPFLSGYIVQ